MRYISPILVCCENLTISSDNAAFDAFNAFGTGTYKKREIDTNGRIVYENSALNAYGLGDLILYFDQEIQQWMVCLKIM